MGNNSVVLSLLVSFLAVVNFAFYVHALPEYQINLNTDRTVYYPGDIVSIYGSLVNSTQDPVQNGDMHTNVSDPNGSLVFSNYTLTDSEGNFSTNFTITPNASFSYYLIFSRYLAGNAFAVGVFRVSCEGCDWDSDGHNETADCDNLDNKTYPGASELCDLKDNDCDYLTDENEDNTGNLTRSCGSNVGVCEYGTQTCVNGNWSECSGSIEPSEEICDGLDNDCDGAIDEGCGGSLGGGISGNRCEESWVCGEWSPCQENGYQTRVCVDKNSCGTDREKPLEARKCEYVPEFRERGCGDGICEMGEGCEECPEDCGICPENVTTPVVRRTEGLTGLITANQVGIAGLIILAIVLVILMAFYRKIK